MRAPTAGTSRSAPSLQNLRPVSTRKHGMSATKREPCGLTRHQVIESGAALAVLGFVRAGFAAEVEPLAPPGDPGVGATCAALAAMPIPLTFKPSRGSASALERVRERAPWQQRNFLGSRMHRSTSQRSCCAAPPPQLKSLFTTTFADSDAAALATVRSPG